MDRFELDRIAAKGRRFNAWVVREKISPTELFRMTQEQRDMIASQAAASGIPIPITEAGFFYHGTSMSRARLIGIEGLAPNKKSSWAKDGYALHRQDRVFFCDTIRAAEFYAVQMSKTRPCLLRIKEDRLQDRNPDPREADGCWFVSRSIAPEDIEIWVSDCWTSISPPETELDTSPAP